MLLYCVVILAVIISFSTFVRFFLFVLFVLTRGCVSLMSTKKQYIAKVVIHRVRILLSFNIA